ncbi:CDP-glycerol glycerophosphotransferase family protein, partial [Paenibacillus sp. GCM10012307]
NTKLNYSKKYNNVIFTSNNFKGFYYNLTSKYVFWGYGTFKFTCKPKRGQLRIELWHGSPLKKVGYLTDVNFWYKYEETMSYMLCSSEYFKDILKRCFGFRDDQALIAGNPRNDYLFKSECSLSKLGIAKDDFSKVILWMPTFRKSKMNNFNDSNSEFPILNGNNINEFNNFLASENILVILKLHPAQNNVGFLSSSFSNIKIYINEDLDKREIELYQLLGEADCLLTDYSSVYFDFLLTDKQIGFVIDDISDYTDMRGFVVENILEIMPGEKISNYEEMKVFINNFKLGIDNFKVQRKSVNILANKYKDGDNCRRLLEKLLVE